MTTLAIPLAALALSGADVLCEVPRQPQPDGLSGITRVSDGRYLAIDDTDGRLFTVNVSFSADGCIDSSSVTNQVMLKGVVDGEGVAWDPLRKSVWTVDEVGPRLAEHDPRTGRRLGDVTLPSPFNRMRKDRGPEALAMSADGLTMWTSTEEAVEGDGSIATRETGSVARLQKFTRANGKTPWKPAAQFAYIVDPVGGGKFRNATRSGLSGLCVLPGGELLALERECSVKGFFPSFRLRLYVVDFGGATDVSSVDRLEGRRFAAVGKKLLLDLDTGFSMYEGMAIGPRTRDGGETLLLVSDGDGEAVETLMVIALRRGR